MTVDRQAADAEREHAKQMRAHNASVRRWDRGLNGVLIAFVHIAVVLTLVFALGCLRENGSIVDGKLGAMAAWGGGSYWGVESPKPPGFGWEPNWLWRLP